MEYDYVFHEDTQANVEPLFASTESPASNFSMLASSTDDIDLMKQFPDIGTSLHHTPSTESVAVATQSAPNAESAASSPSIPIWSHFHLFHDEWNGLRQINTSEFHLKDPDGFCNLSLSGPYSSTSALVQAVTGEIAPVLDIEVQRDLCRNFLKKPSNTFVEHLSHLYAITYPPNTNLNDGGAFFRRDRDRLSLKTVSLDWRDQYETFYPVSTGICISHEHNRDSTEASSQPPSTCPLVQLAGQLAFVNRSSKKVETMLRDVDGKASIYKTESGFVGMICAFLSSTEDADIDILALDQRKTGLHHECRPEGIVREHVSYNEDPAKASKFQLLVRQAKDKLKNELDWVLVASMGDHLYDFKLSAAAPESRKRKKRKQDDASPETEPAPSPKRQPTPHSSTSNTPAASYSPHTIASPLASPGLTIAAVPGLPGAAPSPSTLITIEKGTRQAVVDLHYPLTLQMRLPLDILLPLTYSATVYVVGHNDGVPLDQPSDQQSKLYLGIPFSQSRFLSLALPTSGTILRVLPPSYTQYFQMIWGMLGISIRLQRQPHHPDYQNLFSGPVSVKSQVGFVIPNNDDETQSLSDESSSDTGGSGDRYSHDNDDNGSDGRALFPQQQGSSNQSSGALEYQVTQLQLYSVLQRTLQAGTALHVFALTGFKFVVECLLRHFPITAKLKNGATPLHLAALSAPYDVFELLLNAPESSLAIRCRDVDWNTPLNIAQQLHRPNIVNLILGRFPELSSELVEDLVFPIGRHFDFATARLFCLTCKLAYAGLIDTAKFGTRDLPAEVRKSKVFYVRVDTDTPVARTLRLVSQILQPLQAVFLHLDPDEYRYSPSVLSPYLRAVNSESLHNFHLSTQSLESGREMNLWSGCFERATAAVISSKKISTSSPSTSIKMKGRRRRPAAWWAIHPIPHAVRYLRLVEIPPEKSFIDRFDALNRLELDGIFHGALLASALQHPCLEELTIRCDDVPDSFIPGRLPPRLTLKSLTIESYNKNLLDIFSSLVSQLQPGLTALSVAKAEVPAGLLKLTCLRSLSLGEFCSLSHYDLASWISRSTRLETLSLGGSVLQQPSPNGFAYNFGTIRNVQAHLSFFSEGSLCASLQTATRLENLTLVGLEASEPAGEVTSVLQRLSTLKSFTTSIGPDSTYIHHQTKTMRHSFILEDDPMAWPHVLELQRQDPKMIYLESLNAEIFEEGIPDMVDLLLRNSSTIREVHLEYWANSDFEDPILPTAPYQLSCLRSLTLRYPPMRSFQHVEAWYSLPALRHLDVRIDPDETVHNQHIFFGSLSALENLSSINLEAIGRSEIDKRGSLPASLASAVSRMALLESVSIQFADFEADEALTAFGVALKSLGLLRRVDIAFSNVGPNLEPLAKSFVEVANLESIRLDAAALEDSEVPSIMELISHESLRELHLQHNIITDDGATKLVERLRYKRNLRLLDISHNKISTEHFELLKQDAKSKGVLLDSMGYL